MARLEITACVDRPSFAAFSASVQSVAAAVADCDADGIFEIVSDGSRVEFHGEPLAHFEWAPARADDPAHVGLILTATPGSGIGRLVAAAAVLVAPRPLRTEWLGGWPIVSLEGGAGAGPETDIPAEAGSGRQ
jgi:hypothetical protein